MCLGRHPLPGYGLNPGTFLNPQGFQYTLTAINTSGQFPYDVSNPGVSWIRPCTRRRSGSPEEAVLPASGNVPAPGILVLGGMGIFAAARRHRA